MVEIRFDVPGDPQGKARARTVRNGARTHSYTPENTVLYENLIKTEYLRAGGRMIEADAVEVGIIAVYGVPKSTSKGKRVAMITGRMAPNKKPDADNIAKVVCDALNGVAYADDKAVTKLRVLKEYGSEPKLSVTVLWGCEE